MLRTFTAKSEPVNFMFYILTVTQHDLSLSLRCPKYKFHVPYFNLNFNSTPAKPQRVVKMSRRAIMSATIATTPAEVETSEDLKCAMLYKCKNCDAVFNSHFSLKIHRKTHTDINICIRCGEKLPSAGELRNHVR
jgi:hypothetical protein